jgi:hypothetical protein
MTNDDASERLVGLTAQLSFPRRTGTDGNVRSRKLITSELTARGYDVTAEEFWYAPRRMHIINLTLSISLIAADYGIFAILWFHIGAFAWLVALLAAFMLILLFFQYSMPLSWRMRDTVEGTAPQPPGAKLGVNIVARFGQRVPSDREASVLILGAHYDSVSLLYIPALNLFLFILNSIGLLIAGILGVIVGCINAIGVSVSPWIRMVIAFLCLVTCCSLVAKLANKRSNKSVGAVDNATGCAVLLELARACKATVDATRFSEIRFVFFDAEEEGLWGSSFHVAKHEGEFKKTLPGRALFISLDEPGGPGSFVANGSFGFPRVSRSRPDPRLTILISRLVHVSKKGINTWMPYPASDHAPFVEIGIPATWLSHACTNANTSRDTMDGVNGEHMGNVFQELLGFVQGMKKEEPGHQAET